MNLAVPDAVWWVLSTALIVAGVLGLVLPVLPGTLLVLGGIVLGAWIDGFTRVGWGAVSAVAALAVVAWVLDYVAALLGARHVGASRQALVGAAIGTVVGLLMGLVGVLFMPFVGAVAGEWLARRDPARALEVGTATWLGMLAGMLAKAVLAFVMIGIYGVALVV